MNQLKANDQIRIEVDHVIVTAKICLVAVNGVIVEFMKQDKRCLDFVENTKLIPA